MLIYPFRGILYNKNKAKRLSAVFSPPYDIISKSQQDDYYKASPYNVIRLILNKPAPKDSRKDNVYTRAAGFLNEWRRIGILKQDEKPSVYVYGQQFRHNGKLRKTLGFIAISYLGGSLDELAMPHEKTFAQPKQDREKLLEETGANLSCVYTLFEDEGFRAGDLLRSVVLSRQPYADVTIDKVRHTLWKMSDKRLIKRLQDIMKDKKVFIADGHHRYEAAIDYRNKMRQKDPSYSKKKGYNYAMLYFGSLFNEGLTILSTHRLLKGLGKIAGRHFIKRLDDFFMVQPAGNKKQMLRRLKARADKGNAFGLYINRRFFIFVLRDPKGLDAHFDHSLPPHYKKLDVAILHRIVFENILGIDPARKQDEALSYVRDVDSAVRMVNEGEFKAAFFLNPTKAAEVRDISLSCGKMPHKSTYFYPKLLSGLVMRKLEDV